MGALLIAIFLLCLAISFLLSGMEAGVFALSRWRIRQQMRSGNERAAALYGYLERPETFLWTILVGNTLANLALASLGVLGLHFYLQSRPTLFLTALIAAVLLFYISCELWPKMLFRLYPNRLCMSLVGAFRVLYWVLRPLVVITAWMANLFLRWSGGRSFTGHMFGNREELRQVMQESGQGLSTEERAMINRVLDLQNLTAGQIMVPMAKVQGVSADTAAEDLLKLARETRFSRLPVWKQEGPHRRVVGLVAIRSLLYDDVASSEKRAEDYLHPALYLNHDTRLEVALRQMQRAGQRLAIVLGPTRAEVGVLSLQDILRVIFGDVSL